MKPVKPPRWSWAFYVSLITLVLVLAGCGQGNVATYSLLAESVARTYLASEVTLLDDDDLIQREKEMRTVQQVTNRLDTFAGDYREQLLDELERRGLTPAPTMIGLRPPAPPNPGERTDVACNPPGILDALVTR